MAFTSKRPANTAGAVDNGPHSTTERLGRPLNTLSRSNGRNFQRWPDSSWLHAARAIPIEQVVEQRGIKLRGRIERVGPCPRCGGHDRFAININKQKFICRGCKRGGNHAISLVMFLDGYDCINAIEALTGERFDLVTGKPTTAGKTKGGERPSFDYDHERRQRDQQADERRRLQQAARIWNEAVSIIGTPGEAYLNKRGIGLDEVPDQGGLRFHPRCPWEKSITPCIVSRFTDVSTAEPRGIHRRPVSLDVKPRSLGPIKGCAIRLWPDADVTQGLVIGEGVETVLAAATRITHKATLLRPAWACGFDGNMEIFPVLPGIEALTILVDHDANMAGQHAAEECANRWRDAGRDVIRLTPRDLGDFNDLVLP